LTLTSIIDLPSATGAEWRAIKNGDITTHYSAPELQELIEAAERVCGQNWQNFASDFAEKKAVNGLGR
jgi:hypothetical protein